MNKKKSVIISIVLLFCVILVIVLYGIINVNSSDNTTTESIDVIETEGESKTNSNDVDKPNENDQSAEKEVVKKIKESDLMDYEDLIASNAVSWETIAGDAITDSKASEVQDGTNNESKTLENNANEKDSEMDNKKISGDKIVVIDESSTTIKDESIQNEYDGETNQKGIEFFEVEPSGASVNGDIKAGGKQGVGTWN